MRATFSNYHATVKNLVSEEGFEEFYNGSKIFVKPREVKAVVNSFIPAEDWQCEVNAKKLAKMIGDKADKISKTFVSHGWSDRFRIDALSLRRKSLVEVKFCKLDKISGESGGKCLWDIGGWTKDIDRMNICSKYLPNFKCYFLLTGFYKRSDDPFEMLMNKIATEKNNDKNSEWQELYDEEPNRKYQRSILNTLLKIDKSEISIITDANMTSFLIEVSKLFV